VTALTLRETVQLEDRKEQNKLHKKKEIDSNKGFLNHAKTNIS
jgi:hypothetical protein